ncbi:Flp family type IVb pilin [Roseibium sp. SCP14]|uniref:Flp family type IVb pilin n=1 Tax=Roseibium sp. SCP14 TaxID=3141375 RepID=UPI00333DA260
MSKSYKSIKRTLTLLIKDERGATTIELSLIVAILGTVLIAGLGSIGETMRDDIFGRIVSILQSVDESA